MEYQKAMRIYDRICKGSRKCDKCVLHGFCPACDGCNYAISEEILTKWAAEHPEKTIADDFFEKHPKATRYFVDGATPIACANECGYGAPGKCGHYHRDGYNSACADCWQRPLEEAQDD